MPSPCSSVCCRSHHARSVRPSCWMLRAILPRGPTRRGSWGRWGLSCRPNSGAWTRPPWAPLCMTWRPCWTDGERDRILAEVADNLWRYLGRHACTVPAATRLLANLTGLSVESLETLRHLHLLLSEDVIQLIDDALPTLLRGLRPVAPPEAIAGRVVVRGRIAWGATVAARARRGGSDPALHVAATPRPQYGTAEARLLVRTLTALDRACAQLSALVSGTQEGWTAEVARVQAAVGRARSHRLLATVH